MKSLNDVYTEDLPGIEPLPRKAGRKPIGARAMTPAERKARQRAKEAETRQDRPSGSPVGRS